MKEFRFRCKDGVGIGAAITGPLRKAAVNIRYFDIKVLETKFVCWTIRRVRCIIVVQDSDAHRTQELLRQLQSVRRDLRIRSLQSIYRLRIRLSDEPGILDAQVRRLAREGVYVRRCRGPEVPVMGAEQSATFFLELEGSLEKYVRAKAILHDYIVEESSDFPGGIIALQF